MPVPGLRHDFDLLEHALESFSHMRRIVLQAPAHNLDLRAPGKIRSRPLSGPHHRLLPVAALHDRDHLRPRIVRRLRPQQAAEFRRSTPARQSRSTTSWDCDSHDRSTNSAPAGSFLQAPHLDGPHSARPAPTSPSQACDSRCSAFIHTERASSVYLISAQLPSACSASAYFRARRVHFRNRRIANRKHRAHKSIAHHRHICNRRSRSSLPRGNTCRTIRP